MPVEFPQGLGLVTICEREDPRDAFVSNNYDGRWMRYRQAVSSGRPVYVASANWLTRRSDLIIRSLRGNVGTRLSKLDNGEYDAIILAVAGLKRLQVWKSRIRQPLFTHRDFSSGGRTRCGGY
ncbi:hypothetical protein MJK71_01545 [Escherichia coli]|nr:hypothetical protein MJK71_01545 [Escherichia coli]